MRIPITQQSNPSASRDIQRREPGTVSVCFVAAALEAVRARDLDVDGLLAQVGLSPALLDIPQARISAEHYGRLWRQIAVMLDDEFFGQDSRRMKAGSFAMLCHSVLGCKNLGHALERSLRFYGLILDDIAGCSVREGREGREARIVLKARPAGRPCSTFGHEVLLLLLHGVACWLVRRRIPILAAEFAYPAPAHSGEYRLMFCDDLRFERPLTSIAFDATYLDLPIVQDGGP